MIKHEYGLDGILPEITRNQRRLERVRSEVRISLRENQNKERELFLKIA